jgi:Mg2+-importing ATPase
MRRTEDALAGLDAFWALPQEQLLQQLNSSLNGLSEQEAAQRLERYGLNTLYRVQTTHKWAILLRQFTNPIVMILLGAAIVAGVLEDRTDTLIILAIVVASGLLGFWQEASASDAMRRLLEQVQVEAEVVRSGQSRSVPIDQLAPGDLVRLNTGDMIPADGVVLQAQNLQVNEAILTGESFPVEKSPHPTPANAPLLHRTNALWMGSYVASGMGTMLVVATGSRTQLGQIAQRLRLRPDETDFERGVRRFGNLLLEVTLILVLLIFAFNVYLQRPVVEAFLFSVALAVGLTPQLLPAIITVNLAQGATRMARARVLVKRLASIENLGSMQVLCSDKTGTLTEGVVGIYDARNAQGQSDAQVLHYAALNAALQQGFRNPIDDALSQRLTVNLNEYEYLGEIPYDFYRKRLSVAVRHKGAGLLLVKGALPQVLELCIAVQEGDTIAPLTDTLPLLQQAEDWMAQGYRVLGVAVKSIAPDAPIEHEVEQQLTFVGYILITDPPKATARSTLEQLQQAGVVLKVITGDHASSARALMHALGYQEPQVLTATALEQMSEEALIQRAPAIDVFAEVEPYHKERIIRALRKAGYTVGYLGDGINDAPALHAADVGISVDTAADVAKDAADIVLLEKDLSVLIAGIREGRRTFANTLKYVFMATSANFGNMFSMAGASLFLSFLPLLPKQILLNNFLTDLPEMAIATDNVDEELTLRPTRWDIQFIRNFMLAFGLLSSVFDYLTFGVLIGLLQASPEEFRSGWFMESVISASMVVLIIRTRRPFFRSLPSQLLLGLSVLVWLVVLWMPYSPLNRILGFTPLPWTFLMALGCILALYMLSAELLKRWFYRNHYVSTR